MVEHYECVPCWQDTNTNVGSVPDSTSVHIFLPYEATTLIFKVRVQSAKSGGSFCFQLEVARWFPDLQTGWLQAQRTAASSGWETFWWHFDLEGLRTARRWPAELISSVLCYECFLTQKYVAVSQPAMITHRRSPLSSTYTLWFRTVKQH